MLTRPILFVPKPNPKVQEYLLAYPWPAEVLSLKGFEEVADGELCELFSQLPNDVQLAVASDLDRSPGEVLKKLEDIRSRLL